MAKVGCFYCFLIRTYAAIIGSLWNYRTFLDSVAVVEVEACSFEVVDGNTSVEDFGVDGKMVKRADGSA